MTKHLVVPGSWMAVAMLAAAAPTVASAQPAAQHATHPDTASADLGYVDMMIPHHRMAVTMADLAKTKATLPKLKEMAATMSSVQQREIAELDAARKRLGAATSAGGKMDMSGMTPMNMDMDALKQSTGADFDMKFIAAMSRHHQQAIDMSNKVLSQLKDAPVREFANRTIKNQAREKQQLQALHKAH